MEATSQLSTLVAQEDACNLADSKGEDQILREPMNPNKALRLYSQNFGDNNQDILSLEQSAFGSMEDESSSKTQNSTERKVRADLNRDLGSSKKQGKKANVSKKYQGLVADCVQDSDGEEVELCCHCLLPLGHSYYCSEDNKCLHGECLAQTMVKDMRQDDEVRLSTEQEEKTKRRENYEIGWKASHIPRNDAAFKKLAMRDVPQGMICMVVDQMTGGIDVASTLDPASAVNLEYLSTALEVRRREGHEPIFSLDPAGNEENPMQEKVFTPDWLAGTSVGDVLFQADYHLKELSMGEFEQPVVGMRSCMDFSEAEGLGNRWRGREWFMVRKAEVHISGNSVLRPYVKMGVEAREQEGKGKALEDKQITRADHPMVMYAEAFTKNFDLIAERKSVVFHLRELAKASVIAKYLFDSGAPLEDYWFSLVSAAKECSLEVPQLWNERGFAKLDVEEGVVIKGEGNSGVNGVYGGVKFGLDKLSLVKAARTPAATIASIPAAARGTVYGLSRTAGLAPVANIMSMVTGAQFIPPPSGVISLAALTQTPITVKAVTTLGMMAPLEPMVTEADTTPAIPARIQAPEKVEIEVTPKPTISVSGTLGVTQAKVQAGAPKVSAPMTGPSVRVGQAALSSATLTGRVPRLAGAPAERKPPQFVTPMITSAAAPMAIGGRMQGQMQLQGALRGVDLRLDAFDLAEAKHVSPEAQEGSWNGALDECVAVGDIFWSNLDNDDTCFKDEDRELLKEVFNPKLTDRRSEGDLFAPPDASHAYVTKLRALVKDEEGVRCRRKANFLAKSFAMDEPGSLFPGSWKSSFESTSGAYLRPNAALISRPEYMNQAAGLLQDVLRDGSPFFDKSTEEGVRFRIYSVGSLEVRTIQEVDGEEEVGAVFSVRDRTALSATANHDISSEDKIAKASLYVERAFAASAATLVKGKPNPGGQRRYYVVLETEAGHWIRMERLASGKFIWEVEPADMEDRNSLAKILHSGECSTGFTVGDMKQTHCLMAKAALAKSRLSPSASPATCKQHAQSVFALLLGAYESAPLEAFVEPPPSMTKSFVMPQTRRMRPVGISGL